MGVILYTRELTVLQKTIKTYKNTIYKNFTCYECILKPTVM